MKQIVFIIHGKTKKREKLIASVKAVFTGPSTLLFQITEYADHAVELACTAAKHGATHIICVGGDGSLNEVVNGLMMFAKSNLNTGKQVRIGLLPQGTGNDFARTMGVSYNIETLKKWIDEDSFRAIDIGYTSYFDRENKPATRYFVNITDVGIGGAIAYDLATSSKWLGSFLTYQIGVLKGLFSYRNQPVRVLANNIDYEKKVMSVIVANGKYFGGGMGIAPDALPDDKLFAVVIIGEISTCTYLKNLGNIRKSRKINHPELKYLSAPEILIESSNGPLPIDMDGEFIGFTPVKMKIVPLALNFIGPK